MSEPRFELLDSYARELDHEADLILPARSAAQVRRDGSSRHRRRLVALVVVLVALALAVGGAVAANLTSHAASPNWATTPSTPPTDAPTRSTSSPTSPASATAASVFPSSVIDRLLPFTVSTAVFTTDSAMPTPWDPATTMSGDPTSTQCGQALNGSFVSGTRGVEYRLKNGAADQPNWGYAVAYADEPAARAAARALTRALTVVCTPVDTPKSVATRTDGVEVLAYDVASPSQNGAKGVYVVRDRNVVVYHIDGMGLDANAVATAVSARIDNVATNGSSSASAETTSASSSASAGAAVTLPGQGIDLKSSADINAVLWLPGAAKAFLVSELARERAGGFDCMYLSIQAYRLPDLISGGATGCGGALIVWGEVGGTWKVLLEAQAAPMCSDIRTTGWNKPIPTEILSGQCLDDSMTLVDYTP